MMPFQVARFEREYELNLYHLLDLDESISNIELKWQVTYQNVTGARRKKSFSDIVEANAFAKLQRDMFPDYVGNPVRVDILFLPKE